MLQKNKINRKELEESIKRIQYYLEFYDKHRNFPFDKKRIDITLSTETIKKLARVGNRSKFIEELIKKSMK